MTNQQFIDYLKFRATQLKLDPQGLEDHLDSLVGPVIEKIWSEHAWTFACQPYSLAITAQTERYILPDYFAGVKRVWSKDSMDGDTLVFKHQDMFIEDHPRPDRVPSDIPQFYTVVFDRTDQRWYIHFYPIPTNTTIYMQIVTVPPNSLEVFPGYFTELIQLYGDRKLLPGGNNMESFLRRDYLTELERVKKLDQVYSGTHEYFTDASAMVERRGYPWAR